MKKDYIHKISDKAERRYFKVEARTDDEGKTIEGIAAVVNKTTDLGWFEETIASGAFDDVLRDDVRALVNHDPNLILARSNDGKGTLDLGIDETGNLTYSFETPNTTIGNDALENIRNGNMTQSSFAFTIKEETWEFARADNKLEKDRRTIVKLAQLFDVSPVTYPAYADTSVAARSLEGGKEGVQETIEEIEKDLIARDKYFRGRTKIINKQDETGTN